MVITHETLKNNLETIFINLPGSTAASIQIWFRAGSALEDDNNEGIAHFLEHMFFKGTATRPGPSLASEVEAFGGEINAFTSFDYTCYYINSPSPNLEQSIHILLDMVSNPEFKNEDIIPERDVVFEEYRRSLDSPNQFSFANLQKNSFVGPYKHQILGNEETIKNFSREQLITFRNKFYNTQNSFLVVSGDLYNSDNLKKVIEQYQMPSGSVSVFQRFQLNSDHTCNYHCKSSMQALLNITFESSDASIPEGAFEDLAINTLGHGESSRLYKSLVLNSALANSVSASTMFFRSSGIHFLRVAAPVSNLAKIISEIERILEEIYIHGFSEEEIQKIKNQYVASKIYEKESIESFAFSIGHNYAQTADLNFDEKFIARIKMGSKGEITTSFQNILGRKIHIELQLPTSEEKKFKMDTLKKFISHVSKFRDKKPVSLLANKRVLTSKYDSLAKTVTLTNGVKFVYRENKLTPTFSFQVYIAGGISAENKQNNGIYHLLSNLLDKGYSGMSAEQVKKDLEMLSASFNTFSGKNSYGLTLHGQTEYFEHLLKHFFGSLFYPNIDEKHFKQEIKLGQRALDNLKEDPIKQCFTNFNNIIFNGHPYAMGPVGTYQTLKKLNIKALNRLLKKSLDNEEILFSFCGDIPIEKVLWAISPYTNKFLARKPQSKKKQKIKPLYNKKIYIPFEREQTQVVLGLPAFKMGDKRDLYLKILSNHLSGQSSDLFVEVRDRLGLCYAVQPIHFCGLEGGYWGIYIACGKDKTQKSIEAIKNILSDLCKYGMHKEDFLKVKSSLKGQNFLALQTNEDYAGTYALYEMYRSGIDQYYLANKIVSEITLEENNRFLKKFLNQKFNEVIVGSI